ncbi:peptide deformylase [candidate division KSB1 bacterium]
MAVRTIYTYGHPVLKQVAREVPEIDDEVRRLIDDMFETMYMAGGIGLAAPQVGLDLRLIVIDTSPLDEEANPLALVNPEITDSWGEDIQEEGCLCLPELKVDVKRSLGVKVRGLDRDGSEVELSTEGLLARALQHEIDHLDGLLIVDRISNIKRKLLRTTLEKLKQEEP